MPVLLTRIVTTWGPARTKILSSILILLGIFLVGWAVFPQQVRATETTGARSISAQVWSSHQLSSHLLVRCPLEPNIGGAVNPKCEPSALPSSQNGGGNNVDADLSVSKPDPIGTLSQTSTTLAPVKQQPYVTQVLGPFRMDPADTLDIPLWEYFSDLDIEDPEDDDESSQYLTYTASSTDNTVATATIDASGLAVELVAVAVGQATISVTANDNDPNGPKSLTVTFTITVNNTPEIDTNHPDYTDSAFRFSVDEDPESLNTPIALNSTPFLATDVENDAITWTLADDPTSGLMDVPSQFEIDQGNLTMVEGSDFEIFHQWDLNPVLPFLVIATDNAGGTDFQKVVVSISDVQEPEILAIDLKPMVVGAVGSDQSIALTGIFANSSHPDLRYALQNVDDTKTSATFSDDLATVDISFLAEGLSLVELCLDLVGNLATSSTSSTTVISPNSTVSSPKAIDFDDCDQSSTHISSTVSVLVTSADSAYEACPDIASDFSVTTRQEQGIPIGQAQPEHMLCFAFRSILDLYYPPPTATPAQLAQRGNLAIDNARLTADDPNSPTPFRCLLPHPDLLPLCQKIESLAPDNRGEAVTTAVTAMLRVLGDRYTFYIDQAETESTLRQHGFGDPETGFTIELTEFDTDLNSRQNCSLTSSTCEPTISEVSRPHPGARDQDQPIRNDFLVAINGEPISAGLDLAGVHALYAGTVGTRVDITFRAFEENHTWVLPYFLHIHDPDVVTHRSVEYPDSPEVGKVGYIKLREFTRGADEQFVAALEELLEDNEVNSLVFDLRGNVGGVVSSAVNIISQFLSPNQAYGAVYTRSGIEIDRVRPRSPGLAIEPALLPLTIIANGYSASASELVIGGLVVNQRAVTIGPSNTFGKATAQFLLPMEPYGMLRLNGSVSVACRADSDDATECDHQIQYADEGFSPHINTVEQSIYNNCFSGFWTLAFKCTDEGLALVASLSIPTARIELAEAGRTAEQFRPGEQIVLSLVHSEEWSEEDDKTLIADFTDGVPTISVEIGSNTRTAEYLGSEGGRINFGYTVTSEDTLTGHLILPENALSLNGAIFRRPSGWVLYYPPNSRTDLTSGTPIDVGSATSPTSPTNPANTTANTVPNAGLSSPSSSLTFVGDNNGNQSPNSQTQRVNTSLTANQTPTEPITFSDVLQNSHHDDIEKLAELGITTGCNPPHNSNYCPERAVTRAEMASFLARAFELSDTSRDLFKDDDRNTHEANINRVAAAEIAQGCNPPKNDNYCPNQPVTRAQMATFFARALELSEGSAEFSDIAHSSHADDINLLSAAGITLGCNPPENDRFCPDRLVTRAEMATFLIRATELKDNEES